jgi:hypothetical protein
MADDAPPDVIEVRRNPDGTLDEIVAENCTVHLEQMDDGCWWLAVYKGGWRQVAWFPTRKGKAGRVESHADD